jgi:hypothetical protein
MLPITIAFFFFAISSTYPLLQDFQERIYKAHLLEGKRKS